MFRVSEISHMTKMNYFTNRIVITIVLAAGLSKPDRGGSLRSPASTSLWPDDWSQVPKAFGMLMGMLVTQFRRHQPDHFFSIIACYGAHSMFPNFIHDMRKPAKFDRAIFISYGFAVGCNLM